MTPPINPCQGFSRKSRVRLPLTLSLSEHIPVFGPVPASCVPHHSTLVSDPVHLLSLPCPLSSLYLSDKSLNFRVEIRPPAVEEEGADEQSVYPKLSATTKLVSFIHIFPVLVTTVVLFRWMQAILYTFLGNLCLLSNQCTTPLHNTQYSNPQRIVSVLYINSTLEDITINAPLILKMRDIIFFCGQTA